MSQQGIYAGPNNISPNRDRQPTEKQEKWRIRNRVLWRLKGMVNPVNYTVCTPVEIDKLNRAFQLISEVCRDSVNSSIELGFNAVKRCKYCGKPATHDSLCEDCYKTRSL